MNKDKLEKDISINDVVNTLNEDQRKMLYYLVGYALDTGRNYICGPGNFDNHKQHELREIYNSINEEQKLTVDYLIKEAMKEHRKERNR